MLSLSASADEGMWLLPLLQKMNADPMAALGCRLTPEQIYSVNHSSLKDAIVHFGGGCTGEMISDKGLLVTNHHCGYSNIQALSTPEHNYLEDGYWAMSNAQELPAPGLSVTFLKGMTDVTDRLNKAYETALKKNKNAADKEAIAEKARQDEADAIRAEAAKTNPNCTFSITSFYNQNVYYLIIYKTYTDVRFVGAPPASSGKFGGETDNWMWPRHTCDFSMFRVYAGKDNEPAAYSKDNVPYQPVQSLKISLKGIQDGDFAMIMGYPGSTQRFQTAAQLDKMLALNDIRIDARTLRQDIMWDAMEADPTVRLQYANKYASSANGWKKWIGMRQAFANLGIIDREKAEEAEYSAWISGNKKRKAAYGEALSQIEDAVVTTKDAGLADTLLNETVGRVEILSFASSFSRALSTALRSQKDTAAAINSAIETVARQFKDYSEPLDRKEAVALFGSYVEKAAAENQIASLKKASQGDMEAFVNSLFDATVYTSEKKMKDAASKGLAAFILDPTYRLLVEFSNKANEIIPIAESKDEQLAKASKAYTAGLLEWKKGQPSYPDANSTMRLTYGTVKSYEPKDGVLYKYYTTLDGVMEKEDPNNYEFHVPAKLKEIWQKKDFGDYAMPENGKVPACFLINCDITGGNSGSPVMDADGNLIGLAFDGNWESMSSDVMFEPDLQRCICVDIRYVLLLMDKFGGAGYLRDEMTIVK
ncbi:MAG: S46 family peptidase [Bacteroidales bacterium]|nr:S46 family peptidase [Bacteroidales bacterium]